MIPIVHASGGPLYDIVANHDDGITGTFVFAFVSSWSWSRFMLLGRDHWAGYSISYLSNQHLPLLFLLFLLHSPLSSIFDFQPLYLFTHHPSPFTLCPLPSTLHYPSTRPSHFFNFNFQVTTLKHPSSLHRLCMKRYRST